MPLSPLPRQSVLRLNRSQQPRLTARRLLSVTLITLLCASCAPITRQEQFPIDPKSFGLIDRPAVKILENWWLDYGDPQLNELMDAALRGAPAIALARARLKEAEAAVQASSAALLPSLTANGSADRERETGTGLIPPPYRGTVINQFRATLDAGYDLDLWDKNRSALLAARNQAAALAANQAAARLIISTALAQAYFAWQTDAQRQILAHKVAALRQDILAMNNARSAAGKDGVITLRQAQNDRATARLNVEQINGALELDRNLIGALTGKSAAAVPPLQPKALPPAQAIPDGLTLDLLAQRPDIDANRLLVLAAGNQVDVARAQFYPNLSLAAFIGMSSISYADFFSSASRIWSIGPALRLPLFDGGRLRANLGVAQAAVDEAVAQYNQSVVDAVQQVADNLAQLHAIDRQIEQANIALAAAQRIHEAQQARLDTGLIDISFLLQAQNALLAQESLLLDLTGRRTALQITLIKALGGGYRQAGTPAPPNQSTPHDPKD